MEKPFDLLVQSVPVDGSGIALDISVESAGWEYCGLTVWTLASQGSVDAQTGEDEAAIVLLGGDCVVATDAGEFRLNSRAGIFTGPPCAVYVPRDSAYAITAAAPTQVAVCKSRATRQFPIRYVGPEDVPVEIRGAGNAARQINHIIKPEFPADKILIVEVFTPSGNWSSYPPHKHDVSRMPEEADLEEIYYYRIEPNDGFAFQRLYTADGSVDQPYVIRDGDALIMPEGYHAYAVAHGFTGYYLNILAGPEPVRTMQPFDDPTYGWIRKTWDESMNEGLHSWQDIDNRINGRAGKRNT